MQISLVHGNARSKQVVALQLREKVHGSFSVGRYFHLLGLTLVRKRIHIKI